MCLCERSKAFFLTLKLWIYENHIWELRGRRIRWKKIIAVIDTNFAVGKRKPETNSGLYGIRSCTGIAKVKGSNPVQAWIFFRLFFRNCERCVYNCDDLLSYNCFNFARKKKTKKKAKFSWRCRTSNHQMSWSEIPYRRKKVKQHKHLAKESFLHNTGK